MSVVDVTSRIAQIQGQLALMAPPATSASSTVDFSSALRATTGSLDPGLGVPTGSTGVSGADVVAEAKKYLGVPYVWGGTDPKTGLDCSGLVQHVYGELGFDLPRVSTQQAEAGRAVTGGLDQARPGDVLAFGSPVHHVGIYLGDGQMIEAPRPGLAVRIGPVYETPTAIRRIIPETGSAPAVSGDAPVGSPYAGLFDTAGRRYDVSPALLSAVARQESGFNPGAVSPAGAQGLMQLMPGTASGLGVTNPFDPVQAIGGAARLLHDLLDRFGSTQLALAAYNAGPGAVLRYGGVPPYPETQHYVQAVMATLEAR